MVLYLRSIPCSGNPVPFTIVRCHFLYCCSRLHTKFAIHAPVEEELLPGYKPENYLPVKTGQIYGDRYKIVAKLGYGAASTVWLVKDTSPWRWFGDRFYTLKILTKNYTESQRFSELRISQILNSANPKHNGFPYVRTVQSSFNVEGPAGTHLCLLYEPMRESYDTFMMRLHNERFPLYLLKLHVGVLLRALLYLHDECGVIHTDLKPDNILVGIESTDIFQEMEEDERTVSTLAKETNDRVIHLSRNFGDLRGIPPRPKISDFGIAVTTPGPHYYPIQASLFQAPEVILNAGWSYSADIWNFGVMLWDLVEGTTLFKATDPDTGRYRAEFHIQEMIAFLGDPPVELLHRGKDTGEYFAPDHKLLTTAVSPRRHLTLNDTITVVDGEDKAQFLTFVGKMLKWLPEQRATAKELLADPWLAESCRMLDQ